MRYESATYKDLEELNAGNLYLSIIVKAKTSNNFDDSAAIFELLGGNKDLEVLKEVYEKHGFFKTNRTGVKLMNDLEKNYKKLCAPHVSKTIIEEEAIKKYKLAKSFYLNKFFLTEKDFASFHQTNIINYLNQSISKCTQKEMKFYKVLIK